MGVSWKMGDPWKSQRFIVLAHGVRPMGPPYVCCPMGIPCKPSMGLSKVSREYRMESPWEHYTPMRAPWKKRPMELPCWPFGFP